MSDLLLTNVEIIYYSLEIQNRPTQVVCLSAYEYFQEDDVIVLWDRFKKILARVVELVLLASGKNCEM